MRKRVVPYNINSIIDNDVGHHQMGAHWLAIYKLFTSDCSFSGKINLILGAQPQLKGNNLFSEPSFTDGQGHHKNPF